jgi:UDP-glucose 4-epimerase
MATYLVTGGAGFIGSHIASALQNRGDTVRIIDDLSTGHRSNLEALPKPAEFIQASILDRDALTQAMQGVKCVFHQAALASVPRSVENPLDTHAACVTGTLNVLDIARRIGVKRVVFASSSSIYGDQPKPSKNEIDMPAPLSPYAAAKLACEGYATAFYHSYGLETVALRYFNVFGPRQDPYGPYAAVIPLFCKAILKQERPTIFGDGLQTRDFTYVDNVVQANLLASEVPAAAGKIFNIANGKTISLLDLLAMLGRILGQEIEPIFAPPRVGDVKHSKAEIEKAQSILGFQPQFDVEAGIRRSLEFYKTWVTTAK